LLFIDGNGRQVWIQIVGALFVIGWNIVWTSLIMLFIQHVCRVPLRMSPEQLAVGDYAVHGEEPYTFAHYNVKHPSVQQAKPFWKKNVDVETSGSDGGHGAVLEGHDPAKHGDGLRERQVGSGDSIKESPQKGVAPGSLIKPQDA
jgi:Amt family ammonium transporter